MMCWPKRSESAIVRLTKLALVTASALASHGAAQLSVSAAQSPHLASNASPVPFRIEVLD